MLTLPSPPPLLPSSPPPLLLRLSQAIQRHEIRACIVTGAGEAFSAGGNLDWLEDRHNHSPHSNYQTMIQFYNFFLSIRHLNVPTIAAINGHAIGAGMCMTLGCDFRIAAENAKIGFTFVKLGIHPGPCSLVSFSPHLRAGMGASVLLPRLISPQKAFEYLLAGSTVSGVTARNDGLVLEAVSKEQVLPRAIALAESLSANAPIAVQTCLTSLRADKVPFYFFPVRLLITSMAQFTGLDDGLHREATAQAAGYASKVGLLTFFGLCDVPS